MKKSRGGSEERVGDDGSPKGAAKAPVKGAPR